MASYKGRLIFIATLVFTLILISGCSGGKTEEERYQSALTSYSNQEFSKSIIELKNLLQINGGHQAGRILLAKSYLAIGDGIAAEKEINSVDEARHTDTEVKQIFLDSWRLQGNYKQIIEKYESGDFSVLNQQSLLQIAADAYIHLKQPDKADKIAATLLESSAKNVDALVIRAKAASMRGRDEQAIEYINKSIVLDGENPQAWRVLGGIQSKLQQFDQAIESLKRAAKLEKPEDPKQERFLSKTSLVQLLVLKSRFEESKQYLGELKRDHKNHPIVLYLSGLHSFIDKNYDLAETELTNVHRALPNHLPSMLLLGATHFAKNNLEQANLMLTRYVNQVPTHLQARKLLGEIKLRLNKPQEALTILKASKDQQKDHELLSMIGNAASQSGDFLQGVEYLKKAVESEPENSQIRQELAKLYLSHGAVDDAIAELEQMDSSSKSTSTLLILSYLKKKDLAAAKEKSDQVFAEGQNLSATDFYLRAVIELQSGNRQEARVNLRKAVESNAAYVPALVALGRMDLEDGRLNDGSERLNLVLASDPKNTHAMLLLAQISERSGEQREALKWMDRAAHSSRNPTLPIIILSRYYLRTKQPDKAANYLENRVITESKDPIVLSLIAELNQQLGRYEQASSMIERMIRLDPQNRDDYLLQLADLHRKQQDYTAAMSTLDDIKALNQKGKLLKYKVALESKDYHQAERIAKQLTAEPKSNYLGVVLQADVLQAQQKYQSAISLLKKHLSSDAPFYLHRKLADSYALNGNIDAATGVLKRRIDAHPGGDNQAKLALAMILQSNAKDQQAMKLYEELLSDEPNNIVALNNAALLVYEKQPEKGLEFARRAYHRVGDSSLAVTDTYAWLSYLGGDTRAALDLLEPVMDRTSDPSIHYHYAAVLMAEGRKEEAREILQTILDKNQQFQEFDEAKQLLSELSSANS
ncbi:MAG: PEP-CTERM system TPR-repeat protein PrsT [Candidatus Thiodiazotropha sp.]